MDLPTSQYFSRSKIAVSALFCRLKIWALGVVFSSNFCYGGLVTYLLDFKCFILPDLMHCLLQYLVSSFNFILWNFNAYDVWVSARLWICPYVICKLTFCDRNLGTEPCIDCYWLRTAFLAFATNSSGLHSDVVATSDICFWVSNRSEVLALGVRRKST